MKRRDFLSLCAVTGIAASASVLEAQESQSPFSLSLSSSPLSSSPIEAEGKVEKTNAMIVTPNEARVYSQGLGEAHILVDGERSGGAWWLGEFREDPGFMTSLHFHYQQDEQFF